jgi:hypothetical protein
MEPPTFLSLVVGNTRLHWAEVDIASGRLVASWDTVHLLEEEASAVRDEGILDKFLGHALSAGLRRRLGEGGSEGDVFLASVVPDQTVRWVSWFPHTKVRPPGHNSTASSADLSRRPLS